MSDEKEKPVKGYVVQRGIVVHNGKALEKGETYPGNDKQAAPLVKSGHLLALK